MITSIVVLIVIIVLLFAWALAIVSGNGSRWEEDHDWEAEQQANQPIDEHTEEYRQ